MQTPPQDRTLAKLALAIHAALKQPPSAGPEIQFFYVNWQRCQKDYLKLCAAQNRGWAHAAAASRADLRITMMQFGQEIERLLTQLQPRGTATQLSAHEIHRDLLALHEEFCEVEWDKRHHTLSVTTSPITLEGRYFGPFRIELDTSQLHPQPFYTVVAIDPQPASQDSDITHPHVQGDRLCEGEGTMPIRAAVREGRLLDFFLIINNLLHTYNSNSPYVSLEGWDGIRCNECDYQTSEDSMCSCEHCETALCCDCARCCRDCSNRTCYECSSVCGSCDENVCRNCVKSCCDCDESFCPSCLHDDERCDSCHEHFQEAADSQSPTDVQPVCVGEAAVLA